MADGDDSKVEIYTPAGPNVFVDNEKFTGAEGEVERQRVAAPYVEQLLANIEYYMRVLASRSSMPNKVTDAQRVELLAGAQSIGSIGNVTGAVASLTDQVQIGGYRADYDQQAAMHAAAGPLYAGISVT